MKQNDILRDTKFLTGGGMEGNMQSYGVIVRGISGARCWAEAD